MGKLVIYQSDGTMREELLDRDRISIGRRPDHDICLPFPAVSADHAEIVTVVTDSFLHDLGSTNGTIVNGERVGKHFLRDRDEIEIGRQQLVYLTNEDEQLQARSPRAVEESKGASRAEERSPAYAGPIERATEQRAEAVKLSPVDELLTDLMEMHSEASAAIDMPPSVSIVGKGRVGAQDASTSSYGSVAEGAYIEVMSGPNAGQITPMTKSEFVFGKAGASLAVIRRGGGGYHLVPLNPARVPTVNGRPAEPTGARLQFGDTIAVGGVTLRFNRRPPL